MIATPCLVRDCTARMMQVLTSLFCHYVLLCTFTCMNRDEGILFSIEPIVFDDEDLS
jgi:hypothetical protein